MNIFPFNITFWMVTRDAPLSALHVNAYCRKDGITCCLVEPYACINIYTDREQWWHQSFIPEKYWFRLQGIKVFCYSFSLFVKKLTLLPSSNHFHMFVTKMSTTSYSYIESTDFQLMVTKICVFLLGSYLWVVGRVTWLYLMVIWVLTNWRGAWCGLDGAVFKWCCLYHLLYGP